MDFYCTQLLTVITTKLQLTTLKAVMVKRSHNTPYTEAGLIELAAKLTQQLTANSVLLSVS